MGWSSELILITRHLIGELCGDVYSDDRIEETIVVAAQLMIAETSFQVDYSIDVDNVTMTPDPTANPRDDIFIGLVTLKAACILMRGAMRDAAAREGVRVRDKMGEIEIRGRFAAIQGIAKSYCDAYQRAKLEYSLNNINGIRAIFNVVIGPNIVTDWNLGTNGYYDGEYLN
jgi:hypothetical protein